MTLPNPGMSFTPFDPLPAADLNDMVENIEAIANLSVFANGDIPRNLVANQGDGEFDYVASGMVWTPDAAGSTLLASMSAGVVYINGLRVAVSAVANRAFTASRDTYIDVGTDGVVDYNPQTLNNASPALAANHIRIGIITTGASNIAAAASINQGQTDRVLPIVSSVPYAVTDSLGNPICPRDKNRRLVGYRQIITSFSTSSTSNTLVTGLALAINVTANMVGRKIRVRSTPYALTSAASQYGENRLFTGASLGALTTQFGAAQYGSVSGSAPAISADGFITPTAVGVLYIAVGLISSGGGANTLYGGSTSPASLTAELE